MIRRLKACLLCDDVRTEDNGKNIFVGVYGSELVAAQKPAMLSLVLVLIFDVDSTGAKIELRTGGDGIQRINPFEIPAGIQHANIFARVNVALVEDRELAVDFRSDGGAWQSAGNWSIQFVPDAVEAPPEFAAQVQAAREQARREAAASSETITP